MRFLFILFVIAFTEHFQLRNHPARRALISDQNTINPFSNMICSLGPTTSTTLQPHNLHLTV